MAAPYLPGGHSEHAAAPDRLYCPAGQTNTVPLVDSWGQAYPAEQLPLHALLCTPVVDPNVPLGQGKHTLNPPELYLPG
jgi:hypothetical protein